MESRVSEWKKRRLGCISASELKSLVSASGKITDGNIDYIRHKRFERKHQFNYPVSNKYFDLGHQFEGDVIEWFRSHHPEVEIIYATAEEEIPFWRVGWANFGASPDAYTADHKLLVEAKCLFSPASIEFYTDEYTLYEAKRKEVIAEHGPQLMGQFLSDDKVEEIILVKYVPQNDDCDDDIDSPLADWRGVEFSFKRSDFDLESMRERIILFDQFIGLPIDPVELKKGWTK